MVGADQDLSRGLRGFTDGSHNATYVKSAPSKKVIGKARIAHLGNSDLLSKMEGNVSYISLHLILLVGDAGASTGMMFGNRLRPDKVKYSTTKFKASSEYSIHGIGMWPAYTTRQSTILYSVDLYHADNLGQENLPNDLPELTLER